MAKTKFDVKTEAARVFYAGVGVNDLAVEKVRVAVSDVQTKVAEVQKDVTTRVAKVQKDVTRLDLDPKALRARIEARVAELRAGAQGYPAKVQSLLDDNVDTATDTYGDLVKRGQSLVGRIRRQQSTKATVTSARTTAAKAKTTKTQATKSASAQKSATKKAVTTKSTTAAKKAGAAKSSAKATGTAAKKTAASAVQATTDAAAKVGD